MIFEMRALQYLCSVSLLSALSVCYGQSGSAQQTQPAESLKSIISSLDTDLFNAVNHCEIAKLRSFWDDQAEFLHDRNPPLYGRDAIVSRIEKNFCGKLQRELVPGSMEVYPLKEYGAVEIGVHRFLHPGTQDQRVIGEAKFIHVWKHGADGWKLTRAISYEHHAVNPR